MGRGPRQLPLALPLAAGVSPALHEGRRPRRSFLSTRRQLPVSRGTQQCRRCPAVLERGPGSALPPPRSDQCRPDNPPPMQSLVKPWHARQCGSLRSKRGRARETYEPHDSVQGLSRIPSVQRSSACRSPCALPPVRLSPSPAPTPELRADCRARAPVERPTVPGWDREVQARPVRPTPGSSGHAPRGSFPVLRLQSVAPAQTRVRFAASGSVALRLPLRSIG